MAINKLVDDILKGIQSIQGIEDFDQVDIANASAIVTGLILGDLKIKEIETNDFIVTLTSKDK